MQTPSDAPQKARKARAFFRRLYDVTRRSGDLCCSESTESTDVTEADEDKIPSMQCLHQER